MEKSSAIKCPSISYHLAGTKKIQQELAKKIIDLLYNAYSILSFDFISGLITSMNLVEKNNMWH